LATGQYSRTVQLRDPAAALRTVTTIYNSAAALKKFPNRGRKGRVEGTRELALPPLPFIVVYRVLSEAVEIANIIHGAQRWPKSP
jgi:plasmid stabilization system protein ParE